MTSISQPSAIAIGGSRPKPFLARVTQALARFVIAARARMRAAAESGQLGPHSETEIGRWTGARI